MFLYFLIKGFVIGFAMSAVVGPIGILCIRRSISEGFLAGISTGLGASIADVIYASVTAFGLTFISNFFIGKAFFLSIVGGLYLVFIGIRTYMSRSKLSSGSLENSQISEDQEHWGFFKNLVSTFFMTLTNPMTIFLFMLIFAGLNIQAGDFISSLSVVVGLFFGAMLWWVLLSYFGYILKNKLSSKTFLFWVNRISGLAIILFGALIILRAFLKENIFKIF